MLLTSSNTVTASCQEYEKMLQHNYTAALASYVATYVDITDIKVCLVFIKLIYMLA